jgi:protein TonB
VKLIPPVKVAGDEQPKYSASARRKGIEGVVVVEFEVQPDGRVANARILSGPPELHESVLKAVATWRFNPAKRGDKAVPYKMTKPIRFVLEDS